MNKNELIDAIAGETGCTKADTGRFIDAFVNQVTAAVAKGDKVALVGFGTFASAKRAAKSGRNPKTGETMQIPASVSPKFAPGAAFKAKVNGSQ